MRQTQGIHRYTVIRWQWDSRENSVQNELWKTAPLSIYKFSYNVQMHPDGHKQFHIFSTIADEK